MDNNNLQKNSFETQPQVQELIEKAANEAASRTVAESQKHHACCCPLDEIGVTPDEHKQHHMFLRNFLGGSRKVLIALITGFVLGFGGFIGSLIWIGIKAKITTGGGG